MRRFGEKSARVRDVLLARAGYIASPPPPNTLYPTSLFAVASHKQYMACLARFTSCPHLVPPTPMGAEEPLSTVVILTWASRHTQLPPVRCFSPSLSRTTRNYTEPSPIRTTALKLRPLHRVHGACRPTAAKTSKAYVSGTGTTYNFHVFTQVGSKRTNCSPPSCAVPSVYPFGGHGYFKK